MDYSVITFYRYTKIEKPAELRETLLALCQELQILGRILIAEEGMLVTFPIDRKVRKNDLIVTKR